MDQLTEGVRGVAELTSDLVLPASLHEDGAQSLVLTLIDVGGFEEEPAAQGVVHRRSSGCELIVQQC